MNITNSEIWYNYTTAYTGPLISFDILSLILLSKGITSCTFDSDNNYYFLKDNKLQKQKLEIITNPSDTIATLNISDQPSSEYTKEMIYQNFINSFSEKRIFSKNTFSIDHRYLRFSLDEILIKDQELEYRLYPFVNFYNSGVVIIEFRVIYNTPIDIDNYIDNCINLSNREFNKYYVNVSLSKYAKIICNVENDYKDYVDELPEFSFTLRELVIPKNKHKTLSNVALILFDIIEFLLNEPLLKSRKTRKMLFNFGYFWFGKPHIHIINYSNQSQKASTFLEKNKASINKMLMRVSRHKDYIKKEETLVDLRIFEDFNTFFNLAVSINVWSKKGLYENNIWNDMNNNGYIYSNQIINRFLDYYQMLYKKSIFIINETQKYDDILRYESDFYLLKNDYKYFMKSGELNDLLEYAKDVFQINYHEDNIKNYLNIKSKQLEKNKAKRITKISRMISILFGILSSGRLAEGLIRPLWKTLQLPLFKNEELNKVLFWGGSFFLIMIIIFIILRRDSDE